MEPIVECYSGHTYAQEPRAFVWQGEPHVVQAVERAWRVPEGPHFLVRTEEGGLFELAYDEFEDMWSVQAVQIKTHSKEDQR